MKIKISIFLLFFIVSSAEAVKISSDEIHLLGSFADGKQINYIIKKKDIANVPEWSGEGEPPLSNDAATELALKEHKNRFGETTDKIKKIKISSKETNCLKEQICPPTLWYYKIKIKGEHKGTYIILMDGQFVDPR